MRRSRILAALMLLLPSTAVGCRWRSSDRDPASGALAFSKSQPLLFLYADLSGQFRTGDSPAAVPRASRKVVRVVDPAAQGASPGAGRVLVTDLTVNEDDGIVSTTAVERALFEQRALAALPPGPGSRVPWPAVPAGAFPPHDQVILYGASWCSMCKQAREFLREQRVPFIDRDIERDPDAALELARKARAATVAPDRVPIIDVRGRLVIGFEPTRLATLFGEDT